MIGNTDTVSLLISHGGDIHAVDMVNKYMCLFSFNSSHKYSNIWIIICYFSINMIIYYKMYCITHKQIY